MLITDRMPLRCALQPLFAWVCTSGQLRPTHGSPYQAVDTIVGRRAPPLSPPLPPEPYLSSRQNCGQAIVTTTAGAAVGAPQPCAHPIFSQDIVRLQAVWPVALFSGASSTCTCREKQKVGCTSALKMEALGALNTAVKCLQEKRSTHRLAFW